MTVLEGLHAGMVEAHPRIARAVVRVAGETGVRETFVREHLGEAVLSVLERFGAEYVGEMTETLHHIDQVREHIHSFYDRVLSGADTDPDVAELARSFEELRPLLEDIADPQLWARRRKIRRHGAEPPPEPFEPQPPSAGRPRTARTDLNHALGNLAAEGSTPRRVSAARRRFDRLSGRRQSAIERAAGLDADYVRSIVNSETKYGRPRDHTTAMTPWRPETFDAFCVRNNIRGRARADLEGALLELNAARLREVQGAPQPEIGGEGVLSDSAQQRADLEDDPAVALGFPEDGAVAAQLSKAPSLARLASENPSHFHELALRWMELVERRRAKNERPPSMRNYVMNLMRTQVRGMLGEFSAVFSLGRDFWVLKGPDFDVTLPGTDYVVVSRLTGELWFCDNKALTAADLDAVPSLVRNVGGNMADDVAAFTQETGAVAFPMPPKVRAALDRGRSASAEISELLSHVSDRGRGSLEVQQEITRICDRYGIRRVVSSSGGELTALGTSLRDRGIDLAALEGESLDLPQRRLRGRRRTEGTR